MYLDRKVGEYFTQKATFMLQRAGEEPFGGGEELVQRPWGMKEPGVVENGEMGHQQGGSGGRKT